MFICGLFLYIIKGIAVESVLLIFLFVCVVFLFCLSSCCVLCPMLPVSLGFPFVIVLSVFSNVYTVIYKNIFICCCVLFYTHKLINNVKFRYQTKDRQSINTMCNVHLWSFFIYNKGYIMAAIVVLCGIRLSQQYHHSWYGHSGYINVLVTSAWYKPTRTMATALSRLFWHRHDPWF
jgi:hypothetical protein